MAQEKFTPGPWAWQKLGRFHFLTAQHGMRNIIIGSLAVKMPQETYPAMNVNGRLEPITPDLPDAALIAAAPAMYEALKKIVRKTECCKEDSIINDLRNICEAALSAANPD